MAKKKFVKVPVIKGDLTLQDFDEMLQELRARKGWSVTIECSGVWMVTVYDKETGKQLAATGCTSLMTAAYALLCIPLDMWD